MLHSCIQTESQRNDQYKHVHKSLCIAQILLSTNFEHTELRHKESGMANVEVKFMCQRTMQNF
jgi:hypothetical protein